MQIIQLTMCSRIHQIYVVKEEDLPTYILTRTADRPVNSDGGNLDSGSYPTDT